MKTKRSLIVPLLFWVIVLLMNQSCSKVAAYQRAYINDSDMDFNGRSINEFETNFQSYREGAVGGNSGNKGNGCGCN